MLRLVYFPSTGTPTFSPAFDAGWFSTASADRKEAVWDNPSGTAFGTIAYAGAIRTYTSGSVASQNLVRQYITPGVHDVIGDIQSVLQVTGGPEVRFGSTITGGMGANFCATVASVVKTIDTSGNIIGVVHAYNGNVSASAFSTLPALLEKDAAASIVIAAQQVQPGYGLLIEIGYALEQVNSTTITAVSSSAEWGDSAGSNFAYGNPASTAGQLNPTVTLQIFAFNLSSPLAPAIVGTPYSQVVMSDNYGTALTPSIISGSLPPGLSISQELVTFTVSISGTPTTPGTYTFTAQILGAASGSTKNGVMQRVYSITVGGVSPAVNVMPIDPTSLPTIGIPNAKTVCGKPYSQQFNCRGR
jgi:hypothetical protein